MKKRLCKIKGCVKKHKGYGYCGSHYHMYVTYGNPLHESKLEFHGLRGTPEYDIWAAIKQRCTNPKNKQYSDYGGRGIKLHPQWQKRFSSFYAYVGKRPSPGLTLDRIDNDGDYEPGNMRWTSYTAQANNRRIRANARKYKYVHIRDDSYFATAYERITNSVVHIGKFPTPEEAEMVSLAVCEFFDDHYNTAKMQKYLT